MVKFIPKVCYVVVGTGLACGVSAGLFFGFRNDKVYAVNSEIPQGFTDSESENDGDTSSSGIISASCRSGGQELRMEITSDLDIPREEIQELLETGLEHDDCMALKETK